MKAHDITTALVSRDPFFLFAARGLLGRDRRARIYGTASSLADLQASSDLSRLQALVCDFDTVEDMPAFMEMVCALLKKRPELKLLGFAEGTLSSLPGALEDTPIHALLSKSDVGYCLHLAVQAVVDYDVKLLSQQSAEMLPPSALLRKQGRVVGPEVPHPNLTDRISEIVMWRIFIGLDNPDIRDELLLGDDTVRGYVSTAYRALGASNELEAFDALSEWWWLTRFARVVR